MEFPLLENLFEHDIVADMLESLIYILIVIWLIIRYHHLIGRALTGVGFWQLSIRGFAIGSSFGFITLILMMCVKVFIKGTGVSLGALPADTLADGNSITTVVAFVIGLTLVSLALSFYLKEIDQFLQRKMYDNGEEE